MRAARARLSAEAGVLASLTDQVEWLGARRREYADTSGAASAMLVKRRAEFAQGLARARDLIEHRARQQRAAVLAARDAHLGAMRSQNRYELLADLQRQALARETLSREQKENDEIAARRERWTRRR